MSFSVGLNAELMFQWVSVPTVDVAHLLDLTEEDLAFYDDTAQVLMTILGPHEIQLRPRPRT